MARRIMHVSQCYNTLKPIRIGREWVSATMFNSQEYV